MKLIFFFQIGSGNTSPLNQSLNGRRGSLHSQLAQATAASSTTPNYPKFKKSREKFIKECTEAKKSGDFTKMIQFYGTAFQNFANLNAVFKVTLIFMKLYLNLKLS